MTEMPLRVAVGARFALDQAGLGGLIAGLPGFKLVPADDDPPPRVLVYDAAPEDLAALPPVPPGVALLLVTSGIPEAWPPGPAGLFSKDEGPDALAIAIRQVSRGEQYLSPSYVRALVAAPAARPLAAVEGLTDRERAVLALLADGLSNKAIAARLYLSVRTVEGHLAGLYTRLGVHSRTEAALYAVQHGLGSRSR